MFLPKLIRHQRGEGERGQSLTEFALVAPVLLLLLFAIVDFGMGLHAWITITNSAREGARLGAVRASEEDIVERVYATADTLDEDLLTVEVDNAQGDPGESVVVDVDYEYSLITPLAGIMSFVSGNTIGPTLNLSSTADMRLE